jgi:hypothetical protein
LPEAGGCELFAMFPQVARAIESVHSDDIRDYVQAIRDQVCRGCREQAGDESCEKRQQVRCALDAYLLLVVDTVEEATGRSFDRSGLVAVRSAPAAGLGREAHLSIL